MKKIALWICCMLVMHAGVYEGKIGKYPVTMLLSDMTDGMNRYRYKGKLLSIPLKGERVTLLCEPDPKADKEEGFVAAACFEGKLSGIAYRIYSGEWHKRGSNKSLPFSLKMLALPQKSNSDDDPYTDEIFYYDLLKEEIIFRPTKKGGREKGLRYKLVREPVTKMVQKRIVLGEKKVQDRINKKLEEIHKEHVVQQICCLDDGEVDTVYDVYALDIVYYHKPFLLLSDEGSSYCGGAHPNNSYVQYLFDLNSGAEIDYTQLFYIYDKDKEGDEVIMPAFKRLLDQYLVKHNEIDTCYNKEMNRYDFVLNPAHNAQVAVRLTGMGHAAFACELEPIALIPIIKMKPFAKKEAGKYYPVLKGSKE